MILLLPLALRWAVRLVSLAVGAAVVYLAVTAVQVYQAATRDQAAPAQAILVLGAAQYDGRPSADLTARLSHAYDLWHRGYAPLLVVTGGGAPGDVSTEADAGRRYLEGRGVPASSILASPQGNNTWESVRAAAAQLRPKGVQTVILVSDPFHDARIAAVASASGLDPLVSPTHTSPIRGTSVLPYYAKETVAVAVGRLVGYQRLSEISSSLALSRAPSFGG